MNDTAQRQVPAEIVVHPDYPRSSQYDPQWVFSPDWWRWHWEKTLLVDIEVADLVPDGWQLWLHYDELLAQLLDNYDTADLEALRQDRGHHVGLTRMLARRGARK